LLLEKGIINKDDLKAEIEKVDREVKEGFSPLGSYVNQKAGPKCDWVSDEKQYICPYCWTRFRSA